MKICPACTSRFESPGWTCPECGHTPESDGFLRLDEASGGFHQEDFAPLAELEPKSAWFRSRNRLIGWALGRYFPSARSFLEVGCGTGFVLAGLRESFPELALTGVEPFAAGLQIARSRLPDAELVQADGRRLPFEQEFDVVGSFDVLEHIEDDHVALHELQRAARPDGGLLLAVPQHPWLWSAYDEVSEHQRRYTARELTRKVEAAGFDVLRRTSFVSPLLPAVAISRLRSRRAGEGYDPRAEFRRSPRVDALLERVLGFERALIARGVSLPAGSSLFLVARRR